MLIFRFFPIFLMLCFLSKPLQSQSLFDDIDSLRSYMDLINGELKFKISKKDSIDKILNFYLSKEEERTKEQISAIYDENIYLSDYFPDRWDDVVAQELNNIEPNYLKNNTSQSLPFTNQLAYGLADFLVNRTKEELKIAFFNQLLDKINQAETAIIFEQTVSTLQTIGDEIYDYRSYLPTLQSSFRQDLEQFPTGLGKYVETISDEKIRPRSKDLIRNFLDLGQGILDKKQIHTLVDDIGRQSAKALQQGGFDIKDRSVKDLRNGLVAIKILSSSLLKNDTNAVYVSLEALEKLIEDPILTDFYLALIWQQLENNQLEISDIGSLAAKLSTIVPPDSPANKKQDFLKTLRTVIREGKYLENAIKQLKDGSLAENEKSATYYQMVNAFFNVSKDLVKFIGVQDKSVLGGIDTLKAMITIPVNIVRKDYELGIVNASIALKYGLKNKNDEISKRLLKYGTFMAAIATSDSPNGVNAVIEAYALPVGSFRIKRIQKFNFGLNGYVGLFGAKEKILNKEIPILLRDSFDTKLSAGLTAPIGLNLSWSLGANSSLTIFPQILDLGALVSFRFSDSNTEDLPAFEWQNVIAPGCHLALGVTKNTPLTFSFGYQYGPYLRKINQLNQNMNSPSFELENVRASRWQMGILIDLPIFSISKYKNKL